MFSPLFGSFTILWVANPQILSFVLWTPSSQSSIAHTCYFNQRFALRFVQLSNQIWIQLRFSTCTIIVATSSYLLLAGCFWVRVCMFKFNLDFPRQRIETSGKHQNFAYSKLVSTNVNMTRFYWKTFRTNRWFETWLPFISFHFPCSLYLTLSALAAARRRVDGELWLWRLNGRQQTCKMETDSMLILFLFAHC